MKLRTAPLEPNPRFPPWPVLLAVLFVILTYAGSIFVGQLVLVIYPLLQGWSAEQAETWLQSSTIAQFLFIAVVEAVTVLLVYLFLRAYKVSWSAIGWVRPRLRDLGLALLAVPVYVVGYIVLLTAVQAVFPAIDIEQEQQIGFDTVRTSAELVLTFISLAILPPIVEELTMRGVLFTSLLKRFRFALAAIITSIIFAAAHLQFGSGAPLLWVAAVDTFMLSIVLCYLRFKSGSLWPCIFLHGLKNTTAFSVLFLFPLFGWDIAAAWLTF